MGILVAELFAKPLGLLVEPAVHQGELLHFLFCAMISPIDSSCNLACDPICFQCSENPMVSGGAGMNSPVELVGCAGGDVRFLHGPAAEF